MPKKPVPTRGNLVRLTRSLVLARKGHDLLEQKRQVLMMELTSTIAAARDLQREVASVFAEAYDALQRANVSLGIDRVDEIAHSIPEERHFMIRLHSVMGVEIPEVDPVEPRTSPAYSFWDTSGSMDVAFLAFRKVLAVLARLAEVENAVYRLAVQIRRTHRRVNALEKVVIPSTLSSIVSISARAGRRGTGRFRTHEDSQENQERRGGLTRVLIAGSPCRASRRGERRGP
jgi:H(+)-transporting ATP synthase, vacuolar type, subunit D